MLKIKKKYLGKTLMKDGTKVLLHKDLTQKELIYIKNNFGEILVQEIKEVEVEIKKEDDKNK
jgi:hypothetical protein